MRRSREVYTGGASRGVDHTCGAARSVDLHRRRCAASTPPARRDKLTPAPRIKHNPLAARDQKTNHV